MVAWLVNLSRLDRSSLFFCEFLERIKSNRIDWLRERRVRTCATSRSMVWVFVFVERYLDHIDNKSPSMDLYYIFHVQNHHILPARKNCNISYRWQRTGSTQEEKRNPKLNSNLGFSKKRERREKEAKSSLQIAKLLKEKVKCINGGGRQYFVDNLLFQSRNCQYLSNNPHNLHCNPPTSNDYNNHILPPLHHNTRFHQHLREKRVNERKVRTIG